MALTDADIYKLLNFKLGIKNQHGGDVTIGDALRGSAWLAIQNQDGGAVEEQLDRIEEKP